MKIGELAKRSGLSTHTIRYYERIGLLPVADRDAGGRRDYDPSILIWTEFLGRLKTTGMSIQDMLRYARLREQGTQTGLERRAILETHREMVRRKLNALQVSLLVLDTKIDSYVDTEKRTHHDDNTPDREFPDAAGTR